MTIERILLLLLTAFVGINAYYLDVLYRRATNAFARTMKARMDVESARTDTLMKRLGLQCWYGFDDCICGIRGEVCTSEKRYAQLQVTGLLTTEVEKR